MTGENIKWYSHFGRDWLFLSKVKIKSPYGLVIPLVCKPKSIENSWSNTNLHLNTYNSTIHNS